MDVNEAGKISELAKSLYEHRLAASMEEAVEMAEKMISSEHPGESKGVEHLTRKEQQHEERKKLEVTLDGEPAPTPDELEAEIEALKLSEEGSEKAFTELKEQVKELHEQLEENMKEFEEVKTYLKDIESVADNEEVERKEEAGIKAAEIADKPMTDIDDKLEL